MRTKKEGPTREARGQKIGSGGGKQVPRLAPHLSVDRIGVAKIAFLFNQTNLTRVENYKHNKRVKREKNNNKSKQKMCVCVWRLGSGLGLSHSHTHGSAGRI